MTRNAIVEALRNELVGSKLTNNWVCSINDSVASFYTEGPYAIDGVEFKYMIIVKEKTLSFRINHVQNNSFSEVVVPISDVYFKVWDKGYSTDSSEKMDFVKYCWCLCAGNRFDDEGNSFKLPIRELTAEERETFNFPYSGHPKQKDIIKEFAYDADWKKFIVSRPSYLFIGEDKEEKDKTASIEISLKELQEKIKELSNTIDSLI